MEDWRRFKASGAVDSRNRLVDYYMDRHVRPIAARMRSQLPHQVELDDLIQQGFLGLLDAMDRFRLDRDTRFETFSRRRVFGAIQDYLRSIDPVPRLARIRSKRLQAAGENFRKEHGRPPTEDELRPMMDLPEPTFEHFMTGPRVGAMVPFSSVLPDSEEPGESDGDAMDSFADRRGEGPVTDAERRDLQRWLTRHFCHRDRLIIILYYYEQMTMREIGVALGISESRVSQRLESIIECLRSRLLSTGAEHEFVFSG
jgi:RNA polymerase sigma factor for flagellar operon FliA